jgi:hypothetical protein
VPRYRKIRIYSASKHIGKQVVRTGKLRSRTPADALYISTLDKTQHESTGKHVLENKQKKP